MKQQFELSSGLIIPSVGLGTWQLDDETGFEAIVYALKHGYRLIDAAYAYFNQKTVGKAIKHSGVPREELFVIDKLANTWHTAAQECFLLTLKNLEVEYLDCWLMHWPSSLNHNGNDKKTPRLPDESIDFEKDWTYVNTWKSMIEVQRKYPEKIKSIGVANFGMKEIDMLIRETGIVPEINQVELHPANNPKKLIEYCKKRGIQLVGYSPLGSIGSPLLQNKQLKTIADKKNISVAQLLLSWGVQSGWPVIPRSQSPSRISANITLVSLSEEEMKMITDIGMENKERYVNAPWHVFEEE